ncbi:uncharacterized protein N7518_005791 [Penicillium psychrosexuale]|uniref:uncharacterized protein n=1 Tax=Penicillium psychrosexuale TaxID=1002107 RepID=UPI002544D956|nr:uncharacterized protein N7518_005791 [Penicillium psychrosexuale]KAJ5797251.1 hypothetical protein N7518_005791 [Penicillium psychrosexuale]
MGQSIASGRAFSPNVITRPDDVKIFHSDSPSHLKSKSSNGGWLFHELLGDCMGLINGDRWEQVRAQFKHHFIHRSVSSISSHIELAATRYLQSLERQDAESFEVHAASDFSRFPFMTTAEYLYGPLTENEKEELWNLGQQSLALMGNVLSGGVYRFGLCQWMRPHSFRRLRSFQTQWQNFNQRLVNSRTLSNNHQLPIVEAWMAMEKGCISMNEILQTLSEMLFANLDVSTHVLSWLIIFLAEDIDIQQQVRAEISANPGSLAELCGRKDTLLQFCFLESARLRPFTIFTIPESSPRTQIIGGYIIPPHTSVVVDTLAINYNQKFWGNDHSRFNPHRFQHLSSTELRYNLFTFGFGTRKCLGQHFAEAMLKHFVYHLLNRYEIELPRLDARKTWSSQPIQDTWVPIANARVILKPRK